MINTKLSEMVKEAVVKAGSTFTKDKITSLEKFISKETNESAKWVLETTIENASVSEKNCSPICDDTGIPHVLIDIGPNQSLTRDIIDSIYKGIELGLEKLPGRPMGIRGDDYQRINQSFGISENPSDVLPAPFLIRSISEDVIKIHVLLFGGGPAIRGKTQRIFHKHSTEVVINEIVDWAKEGVSLLGCSPSVLAIGIGRSQYEATSLMLESLVDGDHNVQNEIEKEITSKINESNIGPLGLGGDTSVLATFLKVGPQRSSGVRIVCVRPCCSIEPRKATVLLSDKGIELL